MKVIYERNIENTDFVEIHLTESELDSLYHKPLVKEFLIDRKYLNIEITTKDKEDAIS